MVRITEQLIRKKSEHNEGIISTLEELSLHQEDVERIEHLNWCKDLQILYLQSNLIPKIENLNKLKKLQYLNLAINNIEKVENLEGCESLEKLDLTLNFVGDIESVCSLKANIHLKHLYLTGNPCTDYEGYRDYVIAKLPQLETLDNDEITRSERIKALQIIKQTEIEVKEAQREYEAFRDRQRKRLENPNEDLDDDAFWKSPSENAPETRVEIAKRRHHRKDNEKKEVEEKPVKCFAHDGRPLNVNQGKIPFTFSDENPEEYVLDVAVYKYLDTSLIKVDLQPHFVWLSIKGKIFQLVFPEEVHVHRSTVQRSQTTGHLLLKMPLADYKKPLKKITVGSNHLPEQNEATKYLEVGVGSDAMDFSKIVANDDADVPPLEYG